MNEFNIGKQFYHHPIGRFYSDGPWSGEEFREDYLMPRLNQLKENEILKITIDDNVDGYGSSFLVEGFAGCVKYGYLENHSLLNKIEIICDDEDFEFFKRRIVEYIKEAEYNSEKYKPTEKRYE